LKNRGTEEAAEAGRARNATEHRMKESSKRQAKDEAAQKLPIQDRNQKNKDREALDINV
jgi:hypothetical protein